MSSESDPAPGPSSRKKWWVGLPLVALILLIAAPTIIANTPLRDRMINAAVKDKSIQISTQSASFGYLSPLSVRGFDLQVADGSTHIEMTSMDCERSWLKMLLSSGDLGTLHFNAPNVHLVTGIAKQKSDSEAVEADATASGGGPSIDRLPTLVAEVKKAGVQIRNVSAEVPTIDLQDIDFTIRTEQFPGGTIVRLDPTTLLDAEPLTPQLCRRGMQLVVPMLADAVRVDGHVTFRIDQFELPVGKIEQAELQKRTDIAGAINLSDVSVRLSGDFAEKLTALLKRLGRVDNELALTVSRSSEVRFHVIDGRVHHEGLMFLLPIAETDFEINSNGSVGFDETLDLTLTLGLPSTLLGGGTIGKFLTQDPFIIRVGGTVKEPEFKLATDEGWMGRLQRTISSLPGRDRSEPAEGDSAAGETSDGEPGGDETAEGESVMDVVGELLERAESMEGPLLPNLQNRMQERREARESESPRRPRLLRRRRDPE